MMTYTIEELIDDYAVVELETLVTVNIPKCALPTGVKEGDVITVEIDSAGTGNQKQYICRKMNEK